MSTEETSGARFLDEWKRLGEPLSGWSYAQVQDLRASRREGIVDALRRHIPAVGYAAPQRVLAAESPEQLAREVLVFSRVQPASDASLWILLGMPG